MPRKQEQYCAKLVSEALGGADYQENYRFSFLRGDPTQKHPQGSALPVDAYYPSHRIVLEFREGQHYGDRFDFRDGRITATGDTRKVQRKKYDDRREHILPANGIKLLIIYDYQLQGDNAEDSRFIRQAAGELIRSDSFIYHKPEYRK